MDMEYDSDLETGIEKRAAVDILDQPPPVERTEYEKFELLRDSHYGRKFGKKEWEHLYLMAKMNSRHVGITITFKQILRLKYKEKVLREIVKSCFRDIYDNYTEKYNVRIFLVPEYDDSGNFHYHGLIAGFKRNQLAALRRKLTEHVGFCKIEGKIKNIYNWIHYCCKEIDIDFDDKLLILSKRLDEFDEDELSE